MGKAEKQAVKQEANEKLDIAVMSAVAEGYNTRLSIVKYLTWLEVPNCRQIPNRLTLLCQQSRLQEVAAAKSAKPLGTGRGKGKVCHPTYELGTAEGAEIILA